MKPEQSGHQQDRLGGVTCPTIEYPKDSEPSAHMEPELSITDTDFPSVSDADIDQLRALAERNDPLICAEVTSSVRVPDDVLSASPKPTSRRQRDSRQ